MADSCNCEGGAGNTGLVSCIDELKEAVGIVLTNTINSDNARNRIAITETIDEAFISDLINESDTTKRIYPLMGIEDVVIERAESVYNTSTAGTKKFVKTGTKSLTAEIWKGGIALNKKLAGNRCLDLAFYIIDADGKLIGFNKGDGYIYPYRIAYSTFESTPLNNNGADAERVKIAFDFHKENKDSEIDYMVTADDIDLTQIMGLIDIYSTISNISTTGFKAKLTNSFGAVNNRGVLTGLVAGDFALYNVTDSSSVTITTATENPDGTYTFVFTAQTSADVLRLTPTKAGYDFTNVIATTITIP